MQLRCAGLLLCAAASISATQDNIEAAAAAWERDADSAFGHEPRPQPPRAPKVGAAKRSRQRGKQVAKMSPRHVSRMADLANGAMLLLSAPLSLRHGIASTAAVRNVLLGGWLSSFGAIILLVESRIPFIQRWLRRDARVLTTDAGRLMLLLCAATMSVASGPSGAVPALITLGNAYFGACVRRKHPAPKPRRPKPRAPERLEGPDGSRSEGSHVERVVDETQ